MLDLLKVTEYSRYQRYGLDLRRDYIGVSIPVKFGAIDFMSCACE